MVEGLASLTQSIIVGIISIYIGNVDVYLWIVSKKRFFKSINFRLISTSVEFKTSLTKLKWLGELIYSLDKPVTKQNSGIRSFPYSVSIIGYSLFKTIL